MTDTTRRPILVGVDGSSSSLQAVRWAAREAARRGVPLTLLHSCFVPSPEPYTPIRLPRTYRQALLDQGREWLADAESAAREAAPDIAVTTQLHTGGAADQLIRESGAVGLVVLGSRGLGGFTGLLLGSVAVALAAHSHGSVVVVRGESAPDTGSIVVGVDGSPLSDAAVDFAFAAASSRGVPLVAVHAWTAHALQDSWVVLPMRIDYEAVAEDEEQLLADRLSAWQAKYPDVEVRQRVIQDRPAHALLTEAHDAQLIVVGSHGRGRLTGLGLGSTSQALLHHSECPVAVIRPDTAG